MSSSRLVLALTLTTVIGISAHGQTRSTRRSQTIQPEPMKEWLAYVASDTLQGREIYTEGLGLAASYIAGRLQEWKVKPAGENGGYFQTVSLVGVTNTSRSSVTVDVNGVTRTFTAGEGITLPRNEGGKQTFTGDDVQFVGYGMYRPASDADDYAGLYPKGKVIVWLGPDGPRSTGSDFRLLTGRSRSALDRGALAVISPPGRGRRGGVRGGAAP